MGVLGIGIREMTQVENVSSFPSFLWLFALVVKVGESIPEKESFLS